MIDCEYRDSTMGQTRAGVYEFVFGALASERDAQLQFWSVLGFEPVAEGSLSAEESGKVYGTIEL